MKDIAAIRQDYTQAALDKTSAGDDPILLFTRWFSEAQNAEITEVNAMVLATCDSSNTPHARIVLLKGLDDNKFIFYTNYKSAKGLDIEQNNHVSLVFFWKELERQVRIQGTASKIPFEQNEHYFHSRPRGSQLGAWTSPQSQPIEDRGVLDDNYRKYEQEFAAGPIPCPEHWGGYAVMPASIEFWQGRSNRIHDRILFERSADKLWKKSRLAP